MTLSRRVVNHSLLVFSVSCIEIFGSQAPAKDVEAPRMPSHISYKAPQNEDDDADEYLAEKKTPIDPLLRTTVLINSSSAIKLLLAALKKGKGEWAIFYGEPGIAKSFKAQALAEESGRPTKYLHASRITTKWVNSGSQNIEKAIEKFIIKHKDENPIIVIDEIDLLRSYENDNNHPSHALARIRDLYPQVAILATTNNLEILQRTDPALASRFKTHIKFDLPNAAERRIVIDECCRRQAMSIDEQIKIDLIKRTEGATHREIVVLFEEAANIVMEEFIEKSLQQNLRMLENPLANITELTMTPEERQINAQDLDRAVRKFQDEHSLKTKVLRGIKIMTKYMREHAINTFVIAIITALGHKTLNDLARGENSTLYNTAKQSVYTIAESAYSIAQCSYCLFFQPRKPSMWEWP